MPPGSEQSSPELPPLAREQGSRQKIRKKQIAIATLGDVAPQDLSIAEPSLSAAQSGPAVSAESALAVDDYVVVAEPLLTPPQTESGSILADSEPATTLTLAAPQSIVAAAETPAAPHPSVPLVRVESSDERLAMLPMISQAITHLLPSPSSLASAETIGPVLKHPPTALVKQLDGLAAMPPADEWAAEVRSRLDALTAPTMSTGLVAGGAVSELRTLSIRGLNDAMLIADPATQSAWLRASRALERRLTLWELLADPRLKHEADASGRAMVSAETQLPTVLHEINALISDSPAGPSWRTYLELDEVASLSARWANEHPGLRSAVARTVLARMSDGRLTAEQRSFLTQPMVAALGDHLREWAAGPMSLDLLAELVERYESRPTGRDADAIAELRLRMAWSDNARLRDLAEEFNSNYRNANLRVAFASTLLNRMIPAQKPIKQRIHDQIAGAEISGQSETDAKVALKLAPELTAWRFVLEARGQVKSRTLSKTWPAKLRNSSELEYEVTKQIVLDRNGLHVEKAKATAKGDTKLVGVDSYFGPVPIIGSLVESAARDRHSETRTRALAEVRKKVTSQAQKRMDKEAGAKLVEFESKFKSGIVGPLARFALQAEPLDMSTTQERAIVRLRMAAEQQLAAHTPRPTAPSDSLASIQLHESALNNAMRGLGLDGKRLTVGELHTLLAEKIVRRAEAPAADLPQKAIIEFAKTDAVRVACHEDRVELILNIVEMRKGRDSITNVGVHAFFRPVLEGLELKLVREGGLQFEGRQLRTGPRMVLHSVFGKLLRKDQEVPVLASRIEDDPRLAGLMITQMVIDDGWIAMSIGPASPARTAWRTRAAAPRIVRQPEQPVVR